MPKSNADATQASAHQARKRVGTFIEEVYHRQRLHSALAYQSPAAFEAKLHAQVVP
jgi:putative transposase